MKINNKEILVADLYAGAGGFGLGFQLASKKYKLAFSLEIDEWAVESLKANNKDNQIIICDDIRKYKTAKKILDICPVKPDIIIGGPPCQGFSQAGPSKDPKDPRNSLFKDFARWIGVFQPTFFIMENVRGLLNKKNQDGKKVVDIIQNTFKKLGYEVNIWELNAANYGVPQNRQRVFFVGSLLRNTIPEPPISHYLPYEKGKFNGELKYLLPAIKVKEAIGDLTNLKAGEGDEKVLYSKAPKTKYQILMRKGAKFLFNHKSMFHRDRIIKRYEHILNGNNISEVSEELKVRKRNGNGSLSHTEYKSNYRHLHPDKVSFTIPASFYSNFIHPFEPRNITAREAARLQSFPDNYIFKGKRTQISSKLLKKLGKEDENHLSQYNQIGNAVPPLLAKAIEKHLLKYLET